MPGGWCTSWTAGCRREALVVSLSLAPPSGIPRPHALGILGIALGTAVYLSISLARVQRPGEFPQRRRAGWQGRPSGGSRARGRLSLKTFS